MERPNSYFDNWTVFHTSFHLLTVEVEFINRRIIQGGQPDFTQVNAAAASFKRSLNACKNIITSWRATYDLTDDESVTSLAEHLHRANPKLNIDIEAWKVILQQTIDQAAAELEDPLYIALDARTEVFTVARIRQFIPHVTLVHQFLQLRDDLLDDLKAHDAYRALDDEWYLAPIGADRKITQIISKWKADNQLCEHTGFRQTPAPSEQPDRPSSEKPVSNEPTGSKQLGPLLAKKFAATSLSQGDSAEYLREQIRRARASEKPADTTTRRGLTLSSRLDASDGSKPTQTD
jgi:hypothetical protein